VCGRKRERQCTGPSSCAGHSHGEHSVLDLAVATIQNRSCKVELLSSALRMHCPNTLHCIWRHYLLTACAVSLQAVSAAFAQ